MKKKPLFYSVSKAMSNLDSLELFRKDGRFSIVFDGKNDTVSIVDRSTNETMGSFNFDQLIQQAICIIIDNNDKSNKAKKTKERCSRISDEEISKLNQATERIARDLVKIGSSVANDASVPCNDQPCPFEVKKDSKFPSIAYAPPMMSDGKTFPDQYTGYSRAETIRMLEISQEERERLLWGLLFGD